MNTASIYFKKMAAIVAIVGAGLLAAPLPQINSQSDTFAVPGDFEFTGIRYDVFPFANPQWMHSSLLPHCRQLIVPASF